jgi:hypothetical protein
LAIRREPRSIQIARESKIANFDLAVLRKEQVRRLQIAVNYTQLVGMFKSSTDLNRTFYRLAPRQPAANPQHVL